MTLYATLGIEALVYGINQTKTKFLITSGEQLSKLERIIHQIPTVTHIILISDKFNLQAVDHFKNLSIKEAGIQSLKIQEVIDIGAETPLIKDYERPKRDDLGWMAYQILNKILILIVLLSIYSHNYVYKRINWKSKSKTPV